MSFAENVIVRQMLAGVTALRQNPQAEPPKLPYPTDNEAYRASLLEFRAQGSAGVWLLAGVEVAL
jgi:hypothetical protein